MKKFRRRAADRPAELMESALTRFHAGGFAGTKIEEIAADAGVTVGTVYRYYPSKESLFRAIIDTHLDVSWSRGREIAEAYGSLTAREVIALLLTRWAETLREPGPRRVAILIVREAPLFPEAVALYEAELLTKGRLAIERAIRHGIDRGEFPLLPIEATAKTLLAALLERVLWQETFEAGGDSTLAEDVELIDLLVRGLPRTDAPGSGSTAWPTTTIAPIEEPVAPDPGSPSGLRITTLRRPDSR